MTSDKNVGPLAGAVPDPVYGNTQQRFNVTSDPFCAGRILPSDSSSGATATLTIPSRIPRLAWHRTSAATIG